MTEIQQTQDELIEEFQLFDNWIDRYQYIIDLGKKMPAFPDEWRTEENRVHGCQPPAPGGRRRRERSR